MTSRSAASRWSISALVVVWQSQRSWHQSYPQGDRVGVLAVVSLKESEVPHGAVDRHELVVKSDLRCCSRGGTLETSP